MMLSDICIGLSHVGIPTRELAASVEFYEALGFCRQLETTVDGMAVAFMSMKNLMIELYDDQNAVGRRGAVDHIAIGTNDVESCYKHAQAHGLCILSEDILFLPFWENGIRYFTIEGINGEILEFAQRL